MDQDRLPHALSFVPASEDQIRQIQQVREKALDLWKLIEVLPTSRETSLALTNLEQSVMWANKAITRS